MMKKTIKIFMYTYKQSDSCIYNLSVYRVTWLIHTSVHDGNLLLLWNVIAYEV